MALEWFSAHYLCPGMPRAKVEEMLRPGVSMLVSGEEVEKGYRYSEPESESRLFIYYNESKLVVEFEHEEGKKT
jgi:hypothetical protein